MKRWFQTILWGSSVALSWMWGLGLFFSVQFTYQFGLFGLLTFAVPNALGLMLFGIATQVIARRTEEQQKSSEALANFFAHWSRPFRLIFFLYQILAITLTIFAIVRYLWQPLNLQPDALYLPLTILIVIAAGCLFGEEFNIRRIKYSHGILFVLLLAGIFTLIWGVGRVALPIPAQPVQVVREMTRDIRFWSYFIPICIGFLMGPWMDLQQWQRAIQMRRENISSANAYVIGSLIFFLLLFFHGLLTLWGLDQGAGQFAIVSSFDGLTYAQSILTSALFQFYTSNSWMFIAYAIFICICILTTLDSGYIALKWFLTQNVKNSKSALMALIPDWLLTSPVPHFLFAGAFTLFAVIVKLELEYFMVFYATFFVGYSALAISRCFRSQSGSALPQIKMFCIGSLAVVIFAYGYFLKLPGFLILGSVLPLGYIIWMLFKPEASLEFVTDKETLEAPSSVSVAPTSAMPLAQEPALLPEKESRSPLAAVGSLLHGPGGHFEEKWFVYTFIATYADTNSVGNVYFGRYAMWVGKTRELFFNRVLPKFNLKTSPYYILTRSFEHKFVRETREFEQVSVKIRIEKYNRKFVTLAHEIYDSTNQLLGKGEQTLMFVSSADYTLIDIPQEVYAAFIAYA
ncbi:MAG: acyl-CoA thioesterase [Verrucomicrobiota bacterium]